MNWLLGNIRINFIQDSKHYLSQPGIQEMALLIENQQWGQEYKYLRFNDLPSGAIKKGGMGGKTWLKCENKQEASDPRSCCRGDCDKPWIAQATL